MRSKFKTTQKQEGMTFIGIVLMFMFVGFLLLAVLKIWPMYYENMAVKKSLETFVAEYPENKDLSLSKLKEALQTRLSVQDVTSIKVKDMTFKKSRRGYTVDASYQAVDNFVGNLNFMVEFDHVIELEK